MSSRLSLPRRHALLVVATLTALVFSLPVSAGVRLPARFDLVCTARIRQNGRNISERYSDRVSIDQARKAMLYYGLEAPISISGNAIRYECRSEATHMLCNTGQLVIPAGTFIYHDTFTFTPRDGKYSRFFSGSTDHYARPFS